MKVTRSFRQAALVLPLLASSLFLGMASAKQTAASGHTAQTAVQLIAAATPTSKKGQGMHTDGSMVAWAG